MPGVRKNYPGPAVCACGEHAFAPATRYGVVLVDAADALTLREPWAMTSKGYAERNEGKLHRILTNAGPGRLVDHANHDKLDNRRGNLRVCSDVESLRNRAKVKPGGKAASKYKGVSFYPVQGWAARITVEGRRIWLGAFGADEKAAARAYDNAARQHHGEFALLNFEEVG